MNQSPITKLVTKLRDAADKLYQDGSDIAPQDYIELLEQAAATIVYLQTVLDAMEDAEPEIAN